MIKQYDPSKISVEIDGKEIAGLLEFDDENKLLKYKTTYTTFIIRIENEKDKQRVIELLKGWELIKSNEKTR